MKQHRQISLLFSSCLPLIFFFAVVSNAYSGVSTNRKLYFPDEPILVQFSGAPGYDRDWICIAPTGTADNDAGRNYQYMPSGQTDGNITFYVSEPGDYEVRAYYDYDTNGYIVSARHHFKVIEKASASYDSPPDSAFNDTAGVSGGFHGDARLKQAQYALMELGYDPGPADGILGARTRQALRQFQRENGLKTNGFLDRATLAALGLLHGSRPQTNNVPQPDDDPEPEVIEQP